MSLSLRRPGRYKVEPDKLRPSPEVRIAHTFAWVVGAYVICYGPVTINLLLLVLTQDLQFFGRHWLMQDYYMMAVCLSNFNSAINPFIYAYRVKDVRDTLKEVLLSCHRENWR